MIERRHVIRGAAAALATGLSLPGRAPAQTVAASRTLRFIPQADLSSLDPVMTTAYVVRNHAYMVYDTLYSFDAKFQPRPQMAEGHEITDKGRTVTIRLRDGLRFHDGEPVRAADCVASLRRWAARDGFGATLMAATNELATIDDRTLRFRLKNAFPLFEAIGKPSSSVPFIMPERIAQTPVTTPIRDATGSGPFRFLPDEWLPGARAAYARNERYVPRNEPPDGAAGGKVVHFDRVEWTIIPDPGTATAALQSNEVDWYEQPQGDLVSLLRRSKDVQVTSFDPIGSLALLRFNHLQPPFDDVRVRRAVLAAVDQNDYMQAMAGDSSMYRVCKSFFPCGTPMSSGTGNGAMSADIDRARTMLRESGYDGRKVVIISPTDLPPIHAISLVTEDLLKRIGFNVDLVATDWGTVLTRRANMGPPEQGGWNIFHSNAAGVEFISPAAHLALRGNGRAAWAGWPTNPTLEGLRAEWIATTDLAAQKAIAARMEAEAFSSVPYVPLGTYLLATALRRNVTGLRGAGAPFFWGLQKA